MKLLFHRGACSKKEKKKKRKNKKEKIKLGAKHVNPP